MQGRPNWKLILGLGLSLLSLFGVAYWIEFVQKPKSEKADEGAKKLFDLSDKDIKQVKFRVLSRDVSLECQKPEEGKCRVTGRGAKWVVQKPDPGAADDSNVNSLLSSLQGLVASETLSLKEEPPEKRAQLLKDYGLSADARASAQAERVEVTTSDGKTQRIYFGITHPIGDKIYAGVESAGVFQDDKIFLLSSYQKSTFDKDPSHWRDKKIFGFSNRDISTFTYRSGSDQFQLTKVDGAWSVRDLRTKQEFPGDLELVESYFSTLSYLVARGFASPQKNSTLGRKLMASGKKEISAEWAVSFAASGAPSGAPSGTQKYSLEVVKVSAKPGQTPPKTPGKVPPPLGSGEKIYVTASSQDPVYELDSATLDRLKKNVSALRMSKLISSVEQFSTSRLEVGGTKLTRTGSKWTIEGAPQAEVNLEQVQKFLNALSGEKIQSFVPLSKIPQGESQGEKDGLHVWLGNETENQKRHWVFWKAKNGVYVRDMSSKRGEAFQFAASMEPSLPWKLDFFTFKPKPSPSVSEPAKDKSPSKP